MSITSTLTGKLKSIFTRSGENKLSLSLPTLESWGETEKNTPENNGFYKTEENLERVTDESLPVFDPVTFDTDKDTDINNSLTPEPLSLEQQLLHSEITTNILVSEEKVSKGHVLLSNIFSISDEVLALVSSTIATTYKILPVDLTDSVLSIFYVDEIQREMAEEFIVNHLVSKQLHYQLSFIQISEAMLLEAFEHAYNSNLLVNEQQQLSQHHSNLIEQLDSEVTNETASSIIFDAKVSQDQESFLQEFYGGTFREAHAMGATDCNFYFNVVPKRDGTQYTELVIRAKVDNSNVVTKRQKMTLETYLKLMNVGKYIAGLDTAKNRAQMTGYIPAQLIYGTRTVNVEMRLNVITPKGRKRIPSLSIRFQSQQENNFTLKTIGLSPSQEKLLIIEGLHATDGLIIICGRINCGKNTTLIALINELKHLHSDKNIILLEDPTEQVLPDVFQIQVDNDDPEFNYSQFLKAGLRHNPDIIAIGETRDAESAKLLLEASSVGHLTLTTFHTSDAPKCIERLRGLTGDNAKLADSIRLIISQKLVRKNCTKCVKEVDTNLPEIPRLDDYLAKISTQNNVGFVRSTGRMGDGSTCRHCKGIGLKGRTGIFEIFTPSEKIRDLILKGAPAYKIRKQAMKEGFRSLFISGLTKVLTGEITLAELVRETGYPKPEKEGLCSDINNFSKSVN